MSLPSFKRAPEVDRYRPLTGRRRLLILLLAVTTALTVMYSVLERPGAPEIHRVPAPEPARCAGEDTRCVGGRADIIPAPASPSPASAAAASTPR